MPLSALRTTWRQPQMARRSLQPPARPLPAHPHQLRPQPWRRRQHTVPCCTACNCRVRSAHRWRRQAPIQADPCISQAEALPGARGYAFKRTVVAEFNRIKQGSRLSRDRLERIRTAAQLEAKRALADADEKSGNYLRPGGDFAMAFLDAGGRYVDWPMQPALSQEGTWLTHRAARAR